MSLGPREVQPVAYAGSENSLRDEMAMELRQMTEQKGERTLGEVLSVWGRAGAIWGEVSLSPQE